MDDPPSIGSSAFSRFRALFSLRNNPHFQSQEMAWRYIFCAQLIVLSSVVVPPNAPSFSTLLIWALAGLGLALCLFFADKIFCRKKSSRQKIIKILIMIGIVLTLLMISFVLFLLLKQSFVSVALRLVILTALLIGWRIFLWGAWSAPSHLKRPQEKTNDFPMDEKMIAKALQHIQKLSVTGVNAEVAKKLTSLAELTAPKTSHSLEQEIEALKTIVTFTHENPLAIIWDIDPSINLKAHFPKRSLQYLLRQVLKIPSPSRPIIARAVSEPGGICFEFILKTSFKDASPFLGGIHEVLEKINIALQRQNDQVSRSRTWCSFNNNGLNTGVFVATAPLSV